MKEKTIVSTLTVLASLAAYLYAKEAKRDVVPYMLVAGFMGALVGEKISEHLNRNNGNTNRQ